MSGKEQKEVVRTKCTEGSNFSALLTDGQKSEVKRCGTCPLRDGKPVMTRTGTTAYIDCSGKSGQPTQ